MIPYKQLSLNDIFRDCQGKFESDKPAFLSLLEQHIDIDEIIPITFRNHFYASTGRTRKYPLTSLHRVTMNHTLFHMTYAVSPWCILYNFKKQATPASIFSPSLFFTNKTILLQIVNSSLYGTIR